MLTARKVVTYCAGLAFAAGRWPQWLAARDRIFLSVPSPSFRESCLLALREVGLSMAADEVLALESGNERAAGSKIVASVDDFA
jgi:hypothetical protein